MMRRRIFKPRSFPATMRRTLSVAAMGVAFVLAGQSAASQPDTAQSAASQPVTAQSAASQLVTAQAAASQPVTAQPPTASASLAGTVLTDSAAVPIANAEIAFPHLKISARSDSKGNFQITGVPAGPQELIVRVVGYEPYAATMTFRAAQKVEADFMLKPIVTRLARVNVKAAADPRYAMRLADFEERRRSSPGRFLTADVFENAVGQNMSQVLVSRIPGVRTSGKGTEQVLVAIRGGGECPVQVIINGMVRFNGRPGEPRVDINSFYNGEVIGLEYYTVASTPAQFGATGGRSGGSQCGTVMIWTK